MKKLFFVFLFLFYLVGCSGQQALATDMTLTDIVSVIQSDQSKLPALTQINSKDTDFKTWISDYYLLQTELVSEGSICYADGVEATEIAVLQMVNEKDSKIVERALNEYIKNRTNVFEGYAPLQAAIAKKGEVVVHGRYIALLICSEPQKAKSSFLTCFDKKVNKKINAYYSSKAILQAYRSKDNSFLSERDQSILDAAKDVIKSKIDDNMSDYEKELTIHDYIIGWSRFDYSVFGRSSTVGSTSDSDSPYGVLIDRTATCHGYSTTFQLLMDMLDIECLTVIGIPGSNGVEHSWNMVKLDGEWYCVDCAWDDPIGGSPCHTYFNVTSNYLRRGSIHKWNESSVPEATGTIYAYGNNKENRTFKGK